jgi:hypothetical protein
MTAPPKHPPRVQVILKNDRHWASDEVGLPLWVPSDTAYSTEVYLPISEHTALMEAKDAEIAALKAECERLRAAVIPLRQHKDEVRLAQAEVWDEAAKIILDDVPRMKSDFKKWKDMVHIGGIDTSLFLAAEFSKRAAKVREGS